MFRMDIKSRKYMEVIQVEEIKRPQLLMAEEVVSLTGWSRAKVYAMAASGEIPSLRSGRSVRIPLAALERWIEQNTTGGEVLAAARPSVYETRGPIVLGGA